jgi:Fe-S-cluster formation regulator IscX/YfhJ
MEIIIKFQKIIYKKVIYLEKFQNQIQRLQENILENVTRKLFKV